MTKTDAITFVRTYDAPIEDLWALWTTKEGFESWWGPEGFQVAVHRLDPRVGGELVYEMIAVRSAEIEQMKASGMPLSHGTRGTFTEVELHRRLKITHVIDFIPGLEPYDHDLTVELSTEGRRTRMTITMEPHRDEQWTRAAAAGMASQLTKVPAALGKRGIVRAKIYPHLWYAKDARAAAEMYASIFPDSRVDRVTTMHSESPSGPPGSVEVVDFSLFGQRFQAMTAGPHHEFNDAISIVVSCDDQAELDRYWTALLEGGGREQACGWLIDRFGVRWQIVPAAMDTMMSDPDPDRSKRVTDAMLKMVKLDLATLERAYRGE